MKIKKTHDIQLNTEDSIITAAPASINELVMLMSSGNVIRYSIDDQKQEHLFSVKSSFTYEDGGFDISAKSTIYTLDSIVVIVNDYKRHGFIHYPNRYNKLHLWRKDYHANISKYPIALYKDKQGIPHLIYSEDWNHLQIMNLDSRQVLTASKSLIEENAEERHLEFFKKHQEDNKLPWPGPYDYFYGQLKMSPDSNYFLSSGWVWGSRDAYNMYEVEHFMKDNRIRDIHIGNWEHCNRAACWIDNTTVAIAYNPMEDDIENSHEEIQFYKVESNKSLLDRKVQIEGLNMVNSEIYFNKDVNVIVLLSEEEGVVLLSLNGELLLQNKKRNPGTYYPDLNMFIETHEKSILIHQLTDK
ncbi:hypothetical protein [Aureicoccus marinus]|uniref:Uncharacterized protein n=1 Tax=Aureicoccus marinus TaxID=754435 RepID=A0A2S7TAR0_9FLAO|nr:hypothetical protein [Aureicoccus marinus]PQJ16661.1 hypothetical protein BST99_13875 [Aureicoccus marinus]